MTGEELLKALQALTPEELKLDCVHIHTEYNSPEDSIGYEVDHDIDSVHSCIIKTWKGKRQVLRLGY